MGAIRFFSCSLFFCCFSSLNTTICCRLLELRDSLKNVDRSPYERSAKCMYGGRRKEGGGSVCGLDFGWMLHVVYFLDVYMTSLVRAASRPYKTNPLTTPSPVSLRSAH